MFYIAGFKVQMDPNQWGQHYVPPVSSTASAQDSYIGNLSGTCMTYMFKVNIRKFKLLNTCFLK